MQTNRITQRCAELNPVLGDCGDRVSPNIYFPTLIVGHLGLALLFPDWADTVLGAVAGAELATVWSNWANGETLW